MLTASLTIIYVTPYQSFRFTTPHVWRTSKYVYRKNSMSSNYLRVVGQKECDFEIYQFLHEIEIYDNYPERFRNYLNTRVIKFLHSSSLRNNGLWCTNMPPYLVVKVCSYHVLSGMSPPWSILIRNNTFVFLTFLWASRFDRKQTKNVCSE